MKKILLLCFTLYSSIHAQYIPNYIESSTGLNDPFLDGGRTELELADINEDGNLDIISVGDHGSPFINTNEHGIMVWFGDGTGNWSVIQWGNFGYGGVAVGDVNNDGHLDVGYGIHHNYSGEDLGDQIIEVALGNGTGIQWIPWDDGLATNGEDYGMFCIDFSDVDCDGDLDLGVNSFGCCSGVHIYKNNGNGSWTQSFGFIGGNSTDDFVFGDVNNDGYPDFASANQLGTVYINDGTGNYLIADGNLPPGGNSGRRGPDLGDVDSDGTDELSFANSSGVVQLWKWSEGNSWISISAGLPAVGGYEATQLYDMNMDGFLDLAAFGSGNVTVWIGDGTGNWTQATQFTLPSPGDYSAFRVDGDADHNGYPDIALVDEEQIGIYYQNHLRFFKETSTADSLSITSVFPGPNKNLNINSVHTIKWISEVPAGDSSWVKLEISLNDINGPWNVIANGLPNNGHFQWIIPEYFASIDTCRIRYTVYTANDSAFSITPQGFFIIGEPVNSESVNNEIPDEFILYQNFPNPFNPTTSIQYTVGSRQLISLKVYDVLGNEIATLVNEEKPAGEYEVEFNATGLPSGIYFYKLTAGEYNQTKKMLLLK